MYGYGSWMHGSGMFGGGFGMLIVLLVFIVLAYGIVKYLAKQSGSIPSDKTALDILKERYARGEIGKEEYEQKKMDIGV